MSMCMQRVAGMDERLGEMERLFVGLLGNVEDLRDRNAELCRRFGALELAIAQGVVS